MKRALILSLFVFSAANAYADDEARLRSLLYALDNDAVVRELEKTPSPAVVDRALYVAALARMRATGHATAEAAKLRESHPDDPWTWYAAAVSSEVPADVLRASEKMLALAGDRPDEEMIRARVRALSDAGRLDEALALLDKQPVTPHTLVSRVMVLLGRSSSIDPRVPAALEEVRKLDPDNVEALYWSAVTLRFEGRAADALPLISRAAALTGSTRVHREHWNALRAKKREETAPAIEAALARGFSPSLMQAAADAYYELGDKAKHAALQERILAEAPRTMAAQWVLNDRVLRAPREGNAGVEAARAYVAFPMQYESWLHANGYRLLFYRLQNDPNASAEELLSAVRGMTPIANQQPTDYASAAVVLADRKLALDEAERLAREGKKQMEIHLETLRLQEGTQFEEMAAVSRAMMHDALGWVLLQRGKKSEAQKELLAAWELHHKSPLIAFHVGRLYEGQNKAAKAESMYRKGFLMQSPRANPNLEALKALYRKRFGSMKGFDEALKEAKTFDAEARRKEILAARTKKATPPFTLKTLDGRSMSHGDLKGKVAVINFWGVWCGWCVRELPDFQELVKKYAKDDKVAILTINNDDDVEKVRKWMAEKKYDFPVLLDDRYARKHVMGYPTTWFLDPAGRIAFEKRGWSEKLVEEFTWRIEALR